MKTLSGTFKLVALAAIGVAVIFTLRAFAQTPARTPHPHLPSPGEATFVLLIQNPTPVKDEDKFVNVLKSLQSQLYCVHIHHSPGHKPPMDEDVSGSPNACAQLDIKTDKVTTSETAKSASGEEFTPIQVHSTIQVPSMHSSDIKTVLDALQQ